jgi:hypothetical protein
VAVAGAGQGLAFMGAMQRVNDIAPQTQRAGVLAAFYLITYLGGGGPVIVVGLLATRIALVDAVRIAAAVLLAASLLTLTALRGTGRHAHGKETEVSTKTDPVTLADRD